MSTYGVANLAPRRRLAHELHLSRAQTLSVVREEPEGAEPRAPYPVPEIRARAVDLSVVRRGPKSFVSLIEAAEEEFSYDLREARGWMPDKNGDPNKLVDSVSVRVRGARGRLALVWVEGLLTTRLAYMPKRGLFPITLDQAKDFLRGAEIMWIPPAAKAPAKKSTKGKESMR